MRKISLAICKRPIRFGGTNHLFWKHSIELGAGVAPMPSTVHISNNFEFCTKGGIYVSETFLVEDDECRFVVTFSCHLGHVEVKAFEMLSG